MTPRAFRLGVLLMVLLGAALRLPDLDRRPMHTDEAVHGYKFGELLEDGLYRYDPADYHGPTLNYLTLPAAWAVGAETVAEVSESTLRVVPALAGVALIAMTALLTSGLGRRAALAAAALTAVSPAMVFYSRYYIQEMLLVMFTCGAIIAGERYLRASRTAWAAALGACLGLMHATKETAVIAFAAMAIALLLAGRGARSLRGAVGPHAARDAVLCGAIAVAVSALLYSSFLDNPGGILDSYRALGGYLDRAGADGSHLQPWTYYLGLLGYGGPAPVAVWSEALILLLALVGGVAVVTAGPGDRGSLLPRFLLLYAGILVLVYSSIPYKTPWSMLGLLHGLILLAGAGAVWLLERAHARPARVALLAALLLGGLHLAAQAYLASYPLASDPGNPYTYSQPRQDVLDVARRIEAIAAAHPDGSAMRVDVIAPGGDYWPLPWLPNVGWWNEVSHELRPAPVIVTAPELEPDLLVALYELPPPGQRSLYVPLFDSYTELRPNVEIRGYVASWLWDRYLQGQTTDGPELLPDEAAER